MAGSDTKKDEDLLADAKQAFSDAQDHESRNRIAALDDIKFARLGDQWPEKIRRERELDARPCLTINRLPAFIRHVVNDARQNKPGIVVHPVDSQADPETADILNGLIRQIEQSSDAEVAYDTALDFAVTGGFGYFKVNTRYATDDSFDQDLVIERVANPFSIYGDPHSTAADSSDWMKAFELDRLSKAAFQRRWKEADAVSFENPTGEREHVEEDQITIAAYWDREEVSRQIVAVSMPHPEADPVKVATAMMLGVSDNLIIDLKVYEANAELFQQLGMEVMGQPRAVPSFKVTQRILSGCDVLETNDWAGKYIPIIPVYGEEVNVEGVRHFRGLVRDAKDPQMMHNFWRPLALDTPIPTPSGWTTMGAIEVGDQLFDDSGAICNVVGKSPVHINRDCYRVTFDDGSSIVADSGHPWMVEERAGRTMAGITWETKEVTTAELTPGKHFIYTARPLDCAPAELPVHPYVLGMWLGDGCRNTGCITPGDEDLDEVRANINAAGYECGPAVGNGWRAKSFTVYGLCVQLRALGVLQSKRIPAPYLRASVEQRWALLRGLMDSDGSIGTKTKLCSFTTTSEAIAEGFAELVRSLGFKSKKLKKAGRASKVVNGSNGLLDCYQFSFTAYADEPVFGLRRKTAFLGGRNEHRRRTKRHRIKCVERVRSVPVQCVAIDAPSHLFLAGEGMVPTHNTSATELVALAPKAPFIGKKGAFNSDAEKWGTINTQSWAFVEYDGAEPPQRQPFAGVPAGAIQEANSAADDIRAILGLANSNVGEDNEASGRAILARQKQADIGSFHFIDNLSRAIRHAGRVILDLIPKTYSTTRVLRIVGQDGTQRAVRVGPRPQAPEAPDQAQPAMPPMTANFANGQPMPPEMQARAMGQMPPGMMPMGASQPQPDPEMMQRMAAVERIFDLTVGKYDLTVQAGPAYGTLREELNTVLMELVRAYPPAAPAIMDLIVKTLDIPDADEVADRIQQMAQQGQQDPANNPAVQKLQQQAQAAMQQAHGQIQQLTGQLQELQQAQASQDAAQAQAEMALKHREMDVKGVEAQAKLITARTDAARAVREAQQVTIPGAYPGVAA